MEIVSIPFFIFVSLVVLGAFLETYKPGFFSDQFRKNGTALTIAILGILMSTFFLMFVLKLRVREGFEDTESFRIWNEKLQNYKLKEICSLYLDIYGKLLLVEKGAPPSTVTDAQAREATDQQFGKVMKTKPLSCQIVQDLEKANHFDTFFEVVYSMNNEFLAEAYETALACRTLLINQYLDVQEAKRKRKEGFQGDICEKPIAEEKRKRIQEAKEKQKQDTEMNSCTLPEEIPKQDKETYIQKKLETLEGVFQAHLQKNQYKDSIEKILNDCQYYKGELEKDQKDAESGKIGT